jgi:hypothetical protein
MKKRYVWTIAVLVCLGIGLAGCGDSGPGGGGTPQSVTYSNTAPNGDKYELTITESNALYAAQPGDSYVLKVTYQNGQVKISLGTVESVISGTFTLKPSNAAASASFSITVNANVITQITITGTITYEDGSTAAAPASLNADKTALTAAIVAANEAKTGVVTATGASNVPEGTKWVTQSVLDALNSAIADAEAKAVKPDATQSEVDTVVSALNSAITTFNNAKEDGSGTGVTVADKTALNNKIAEAKDAKTGVVAADNATALASGTVWVTTTAMTTFNAAIIAAETAAADVSATEQGVATAVTTLNNAITAFNTAKATVTIADKTALGAAITTANAAKNGVEESADGSGLNPGIVWVTPEAMTTFEAAITAAEGVDTNGNATQPQVDSAVTALNAAIAAFNAAKHTVSGSGTNITLINIPSEITGEVAVGLFPGTGYPEAVGIGTVSGGSVTVTLSYFTGDQSNPLGNPWTDDGRSYLVMIMFGEGYESQYRSPGSMKLPAGGIIDTSDFEVSGPVGEPVGNITGTFTITSDSSNPTISEIRMGASQPGMAGWQSWQITLDNPGTSDIPFDIPLYDEDMRGTFSSSEKVYINMSILFDDGTNWSLYFSGSGEGYSVSSHTGTTNLNSIGTGVIPKTRIVTGTANISITGKTLMYGEVYLSLPYGNGSWAEVKSDNSWKLRVPYYSSLGFFTVSGNATDGTNYAKGANTTWYGESSVSLGTITLTAADLSDGSTGSAEQLIIDLAYQGNYQGYEGSGTMTLMIDETFLSWTGQSSGSMFNAFTYGGGNLTYQGGPVGTWAYVYLGSAKQGFIMDLTGHEKHIWLGAAATAVKTEFETMFGVTLDLSYLDPTANNLEASTDIIVGDAPYELGTTGQPDTASHAEGLHTHYTLSGTYNDEVEALTQQFGRPPNETSGVMNHVSTTLTAGNDWVILEDWPKEVRIIQKVSGGTPSGVSWHKPPAPPAP